MAHSLCPSRSPQCTELQPQPPQQERPLSPSYQCKRRVEKRDHDVSHGQVDDEQTGGGTQAFALDDDVADQDVAEEGEDDDDGIRRDEQSFGRHML